MSSEVEDELVAVGLKHLHQANGPKKQQERHFGVDDTSKESEPLRDCRRPFGLSHAAISNSLICA